MNTPAQAPVDTEQSNRALDTGDRKSIFDKLRNIWVKQKACDNADQLVRSKDFRRAFSKVLNLHPEYDKESILRTLLNIRDQTYISPEKQNELLSCISDPEFILNAKYTQNRLKGFAAREAAIFLELYPVSEVLKQLKLYVSSEVKEIFVASQDEDAVEELPDHETNLSNSEYSVDIERKILGVDYILAKKEINGKIKWACKTKGSLLFNCDFVYDNISGLSEFGDTKDKVFISVSKDDKSAYISLEQIIHDNDIHEEQRFDSVGNINLSGEQIIYDATENRKKGFIVVGKEKETRGNILFDTTLYRPILDGPRFYLATIGNKEAYFEQGVVITKEDLARMTQDISDMEEDKNGDFFYTYKQKGKFFRKKTIKYVFEKSQIDKPIVRIEPIEEDEVIEEITEKPEEITIEAEIKVEIEKVNQKVEQQRKNEERIYKKQERVLAKLQERKERQARMKKKIVADEGHKQLNNTEQIAVQQEVNRIMEKISE